MFNKEIEQQFNTFYLINDIVFPQTSDLSCLIPLLIYCGCGACGQTEIVVTVSVSSGGNSSFTS